MTTKFSNQTDTTEAYAAYTHDNVRVTPWVPFNQIVNYCTILQGPDMSTLNKVESPDVNEY